MHRKMTVKNSVISISSFSFVTLLVATFLFLTSCQVSQTEANTDTQIKGVASLSAAFIKVAKDVKPSVVNISTTKVIKRGIRGTLPRDPFRDFFGDDLFKRFFPEVPRTQRRQSLGSGFIISKDGYILTNDHVVDDADEIKVALQDKREFVAKVIGKDRDTDVALIKIDAHDLKPARLGDSSKLQVGEWVVAIGNPLKLSHTQVNHQRIFGFYA